MFIRFTKQKSFQSMKSFDIDFKYLSVSLAWLSKISHHNFEKLMKNDRLCLYIIIL